MKAAVFDEFRRPPEVRTVPDPIPSPDAAIVQVRACGICRSDWHGWMGHDPDVKLPHVPGHELAGNVAAVGSLVQHWKPGQRVTAPFCCGCGTCAECRTGNQHICDNYTQPGFTQWGAFADFVEIRFADVNLVELPESIDFVTAAGLGCRFATSFRAVICQGAVSAGDWVAVHGCGGVGLSAVMIASAVGARVIAVDVRSDRLDLARQCGAMLTLDACKTDVVHRIRELSAGGVHLSVDGLGSRETCRNSIGCLRKRGRHVQVGLMLGDDANPEIPMDVVIGRELQVIGSHGMQAFEYPRMLRMITDGQLSPGDLISDVVDLEQACRLLPRLNEFPGSGISVLKL